jgi:hypothetical protein
MKKSKTIMNKLTCIYVAQANGSVAVLFGNADSTKHATSEEEVYSLIAKVAAVDDPIVMLFENDSLEETYQLAAKFAASQMRPMVLPFIAADYKEYCQERSLPDTAENRVHFSRYEHQRGQQAKFKRA